MKRYLIVFLMCVVPILGILAQEVEIYGYFEPQYMGLYKDENYFQINSNKLRVDLKSKAVENTEFGANLIYLLNFGKKSWNIMDFLPDRVTSDIPIELYPLFQFTYRDTLYLDNVYARLSFNRFAITVGKQQISLGTGYFSNPTDVFNVKDALDPTYEQPGHNAVRMDLYLGTRLSLMALYSPIGIDWCNSGKLVRMKAGLGHFDFSVLVNEMQYVNTDFYTFQTQKQLRRYIGLNFVGELLGFGVWGEGAYNFLNEDNNFYEFIVGADYTFKSGLYTLIEYHHNSLAKSDYEEYDLNDWMRFFVGETKTIARDQVYGFIQYPLTDLIAIGTSAIISVSDMSAVFVPTLYYSLFENVELTLIMNFYVGDEEKVYNSNLGNGGFMRANIYF
jgi:hypothetical protein